MDEVRPLNGDGFGVGWYDPQEKQSPPCIFTSTLPAWNNLNLIRLAEKVKSPLLFAHVRAASSGFPISESNCHPWQYGNLMWMHNGYVSGFSKIKRRLQNTLPDPIFHSILGSTDSEWSFGLFLSQLQDPLKKVFEPEELKDAMSKTIELLRIWSEEAGITEPSLLNFAVTDGATIVCSRYINCSDREAASLYYSSGTRFDKLSDGRYQMVKRDKREEMVVVASEPITVSKHPCF
ncbi:nucleophile aminohydrolase [Paraphysoderma sedebokerense]|nr:nucleophile aminohydrolase [Paraphysoderma sedebokerense]